MPKQSRFYVESNGIKLHVLEYGASGPPVLLLPGIINPAITMGFVGEELGRDCRVFILDARGRGLSDQRPGLGHTTGDYAEDAAGVIEAFGLSPAIIIGHSMGARVAARLAAQRPELIHRCILADPPVSGPGRRPYPSSLPNYFNAVDGALQGNLAANPKISDAQFQLRLEWLPTCSKEAIRGSLAAFNEDDMFADLPKIECPTLLVYGGQSDVVMDTDATEIVSLLKNGRQTKIDHVGHLMPLEDLESFVTAVRPFIHNM